MIVVILLPETKRSGAREVAEERNGGDGLRRSNVDQGAAESESFPRHIEHLTSF